MIIKSKRLLKVTQIAKDITLQRYSIYLNVIVISQFKTPRRVNRYGIWVSHVLKVNNLMDGISICDSLLRCNKTSRAVYLVFY